MYDKKISLSCSLVRAKHHQLLFISLNLLLPILCLGATEVRTLAQVPVSSSSTTNTALTISTAGTEISQNLQSIPRVSPDPILPSTTPERGLPAPLLLPSPVKPTTPPSPDLPQQLQPNEPIPSLPQPTPSNRLPTVAPGISPSSLAPLDRLNHDPQYLTRPRPRDPKTVKPITTKITIDGVPYTHRSEYETTIGASTGDQRSTNFAWNTSWLTGVAIEESTSTDRVYRRAYQSNYNRFSSFQQQREVVTKILSPETALGFRQQFSLTADCLPGSAPLGADGNPQICTYTPGISTDLTSIDPKTLNPTNFNDTSKFQDVVSPASLAAIKEPGFRAGANGEEFGVDIYVPVSGTRAGNTQSNTSQVDRREFITNNSAITTGKMRQVIVSNGSENALARTVRGFTYVGGDPNFVLNSAVTLATVALPDAETSLKPSNERKPNFSTTLFAAADNARIPENSFTAYSAGWGSSTSPNQKNTIPTANYHGIWIGLSPVVYRQVIIDKSFTPTGPEIIASVQGNEGMTGNNITTNITIDGQTYSNASLNNAYSQGFVTLYERDINTLNTFVIREKTNYYPHLSFTGNVTTADSVLRYYSGGVFIAGIENQPQTAQAYIGADFQKEEAGGLSYKMGAIGYINPTPEDYSQANASIAKRITLGNDPQNTLTLSSSALYAIDGSTIINNSLFSSGSSYVNVGATAKIGSIAIGTTYFIPTGLPNEVESLLSTTISWRATDSLAFSGYFTPINNNTSRSTMGASASWRLGKDYNSPTVSLSWTRNEIDFARGRTNPINNYSDNVFGVYLRFGAPGNPLVQPNP